MAKSKQDIINDIAAYIAKNGGRNADWYVGISKTPRDRLFNGHTVNEKKDSWIYSTAYSSDDARAIEDHFLSKGCDGGGGGGDDDSDAVYAYAKSTTTDP